MRNALRKILTKMALIPCKSTHYAMDLRFPKNPKVTLNCWKLSICDKPWKYCENINFHLVFCPNAKVMSLIFSSQNCLSSLDIWLFMRGICRCAKNEKCSKLSHFHWFELQISSTSENDVNTPVASLFGFLWILMTFAKWSLNQGKMGVYEHGLKIFRFFSFCNFWSRAAMKAICVKFGIFVTLNDFEAGSKSCVQRSFFPGKWTIFLQKFPKKKLSSVWHLGPRRPTFQNTIEGGGSGEENFGDENFFSEGLRIHFFLLTRTAHCGTFTIHLVL